VQNPRFCGALSLPLSGSLLFSVVTAADSQTGVPASYPSIYSVLKIPLDSYDKYLAT
jgi:hypothetical protein